jgi:hypothetical protein
LGTIVLAPVDPSVRLAHCQMIFITGFGVLVGSGVLAGWLVGLGLDVLVGSGVFAGGLVGLGFGVLVGSGVFVGWLVGLGLDVLVARGVLAAEGVSPFLVQNARTNTATIMMPTTRTAVRVRVEELFMRISFRAQIFMQILSSSRPSC